MPKPPPLARETATMVRLSDELAAALRRVFRSSRFEGLGPVPLSRALKVDKTFASRLMSALRASDSLVALSLLPGVVPLRQFLAASREHGADARSVQAAERTLRAFEHELQRGFGTRTRLDAVIADALPEARRRHEVTARQAVYRGMALIKGVSLDLESLTWIVHPRRRDPRRVDMLFLAAYVGIQRLRPTARVRLGASHERTRPEDGAQLLRRFCRPADLSITTSTEKDFTFYEISTGSVRRDAAADVFLSEFLEASPSRPAARGRALPIVGDVVSHPTKRLEMVLLVHDDAWTGADFALAAYDTAGRGLAVLSDPERDADRLPLDATIIRTPALAETLRSSPVPRYAEMLRHLMTPLGWSLTSDSGQPQYRAVTCRIDYPLYGGQIMLFQP